jgi:hypothetical protein
MRREADFIMVEKSKTTLILKLRRHEMLEKENFKRTERNRYQAEVGYQAAITQHPYRKMSPKREVRVHVSARVKKGPLESRG